MAHFAAIDENNIVQVTIVVPDDTVTNNGGEYSAQVEQYVKDKFGKNYNSNYNWKQCSYNHNRRKQYPGINFSYDPVTDRFIAPKPETYTSWSLNADGDWVAPVERPTIDLWPADTDNVVWKESEQCWYAYIYKTHPTFDENGVELTPGEYAKRAWDPGTSSFGEEQASSTIERTEDSIRY
tara:strand:- start:5464 stop:6006 length:543 start_codon:yes stop_codon:yes gene_type:complete